MLTTLANGSIDISGSTAIFASLILKISCRASWSGASTYKILSSRPGRMRAESWYQRGLSPERGHTRTSGLLVAPTTITFDNSSIPSISLSRLVRTPLCGESPSERAVPIASISSCVSAIAVYKQQAAYKEYNGGRSSSCFPEYLSYCPFGLSDILIQKLRVSWSPPFMDMDPPRDL
jgi:hypothetical protein